MNLIHLFLALFPVCLNAVITASGSSCGENVKETMRLIYFIFCVNGIDQQIIEILEIACSPLCLYKLVCRVKYCGCLSRA